jgi:polysaccharide export outer membrane protein
MMRTELSLRTLLICMACACGSVLLIGCAGSGPRGRELLVAGNSNDSMFAVVPINAQSIEVVSAWHRPSLSAVFGDYRRANVQRVHVGDAIQINIWETGSGGIFSASQIDRSSSTSRPSLIPEQTVAADGTINVPYAGLIKVAGLTTREIENQIVRRLEGRAAQPQAMVTLTRNLSNSVTVTGDVTTGARVPLNGGGDRVLDVIAAAGGIKAPVSETFVLLARNGQTLNVPLQTLLANSRENVYLRPGDVVTVVRAPQSFTAIGATGRQAHVGFDAGGITLEEALGKAGGLLDERADPRGVFVLRYEPSALVSRLPNVRQYLLGGSSVPVVYQIDISNAESLFYARRFAMRDKDILYVSNAPLSEIEKVLRVLGTLTAPAVSAYTVSKIQ